MSFTKGGLKWLFRTRMVLAALVLIQAAVAVTPCAFTFYLLVYRPYKAFFDFFKPYYRTAIMNHYRRLIIGLRLCQLCQAMGNHRVNAPVAHHDNLLALKKSATEGCWLCSEVHCLVLHWDRLRDELQEPLSTERVARLRTESGSIGLLTWFSRRVEKRTGF